MDNTVNIFKLVQNHHRRLESTFKLELAGHHAKQYDSVETTYYGCNFSIILSGQGSYTHLGTTYTVKAPCVIIQWPGEQVCYGPDKGTSWQELYLVYSSELLDKLIERKFFHRQKTYWQFVNKRLILPMIYKFVEQLSDLTPSTELDLLDSSAESIIMHTLLNESALLKEDKELIAYIVKELQTNPAHDYHFDELARQNGMSPATFRRKWMKQVGIPPGKFHIQKRIEEACRMLSETTLTVNAIAESLNFTDPLYFRRRFKIETNTTPSSYRKHSTR